MNNMNFRNQNNMSCKLSCNCNCKPACDSDSSVNDDELNGMPVGMGYVPWQQWDKVYDIAQGLQRGTIFPCLDLPFYGCNPNGCRNGGAI